MLSDDFVKGTDGHTLLISISMMAQPEACRRGASSQSGRPLGPCPAQHSAAAHYRSRLSAPAARRQTRQGSLWPARPAPPGRLPGSPRASPPAATTCNRTPLQKALTESDDAEGKGWGMKLWIVKSRVM